MFIAMLFTVAKVWKQPKYPSTYEWIKNICVCTHTHIYTVYIAFHYIYSVMEYYSPTKG